MPAKHFGISLRGAVAMNAETDYVDPSIVIETEELEARLGDPDLRVIDCDIVLEPKPGGGYDATPGLANWQEAHVPGSIYIDIGSELSADHPRLRYMLPSARRFGRVMSARGIGDAHQVVVYSRGGNFWATRLFLMFREFGFRRVRVLNGAWDKWVAERRPTTSAAPDWPATTFTAREPVGGFVTKEAVLDALDDADSCVMNALSPALHSGEKFNPSYGRPGRIGGSVNLFCMKLIDRETNRFLYRDELEKKFAPTGALEAGRVVTYCGGGISATTNAFALHLLGRSDAVVYDGSLSEWGHDETLPMEID